MPSPGPSSRPGAHRAPANPGPSRSRALARALLSWYRLNRRDLPWRRTRDPYRIWVSEVMLQQTTVSAVIPYYRRFLQRFPTLRSLSRAPVEPVLALWSGLGYYRRARHLHAAARLIEARHGGRFPRDAGEVRALPGIGRYTAGAILSIAFGEKEPVLDGNVARVLSRQFLIEGDARGGANQRRLWSLARVLVEAAADPGDLNQALMELGATLCSPAAPSCGECPIAKACAARAAGRQEKIPPPRRAHAPVSVRAAVAIVLRRGRLLMRRRAETGLMDGLWEFPGLRIPGARGAAGGGRGAGTAEGGVTEAGEGGLRLRPLGRIATVHHSITFRRIALDVHRARLLAEPPRAAYRWISPARARRLPTSSLVSKILSVLKV